MYRTCNCASLLVGLALAATGCAPSAVAVVGDGGVGASDLNSAADLAPPDLAKPPDLAGLETWRWIDVADSVCANGQSTGIGVNLTNRSSDVVVIVQGGGACWEGDACAGYPFPETVPANFGSGFKEANLAAQRPELDRADPNNPLRDANVVFIPYCTGDLFTGDRVTTYSTSLAAQIAGKPATFTVHHKGSVDMAAFTRVIGQLFPGQRRVLLVGISAGGFGAQLNYQRIANGLPNAEVHLLADCAQLVHPRNGIHGTMTTAWNLQVPAGCADCRSSFPAVADFLFSSYPNRRFALLAYDQDAVVRTYFGYPLDPQGFQVATNALLAKSYEPRANAHYFLLSGTAHTMLGGLGKIASPGGLMLSEWVRRWMSGDPQWANSR